MLTTLHADLQAVYPELIEITHAVGNRWFLHFSVSTAMRLPLTRLRKATGLQILCGGRTDARAIQDWQPRAQGSPEGEWVGAMIQEDAQRV